MFRRRRSYAVCGAGPQTDPAGGSEMGRSTWSQSGFRTRDLSKNEPPMWPELRRGGSRMAIVSSMR